MTGQARTMDVQRDHATRATSARKSKPPALTRAEPASIQRAVLNLQQTAGNHAVQGLIQRARESEQDAVAAGQLDEELNRSIQRARGTGRPLDGATNAHMSQAFGADFGSVRVHTDAQAGALSRSLSAKAFTLGNDIFFNQDAYHPGNSGGRQLLAHELAHVVQQGGAAAGNRAQTKLAVGPAGDRYEQEADAVAARVMRGTTAGGVIRRAPAIQRALFVGGNEMEDIETATGITKKNVTAARGQGEAGLDTANPKYRKMIGGQAVTNLDEAWRQVQGADPAIKNISFFKKRWMKARLKKWITREGRLDVRGAKAARVLFQKSDERRYESWQDVAVALTGEEKARPNREKEKSLARKVSKNTDLRRDLASALRALYNIIETRADKDQIWQKLGEHQSKFPHWYPRNGVKARMSSPALNRVSSNWVILHDVLFYLERSERIRAFEEVDRSPKLGSTHMPGEARHAEQIGNATGETFGRHAVIEKNKWVKAARARNMPLGAGASNTTDFLLTAARLLNLNAEHKRAIAWGAFVFWNKAYYQISAGGHTFHEIMDVANTRTGGLVDYDPDAANPYKTGYNQKKAEPDNLDAQQALQVAEEFEAQEK
jgi:hypothetical protein